MLFSPSSRSVRLAFLVLMFQLCAANAVAQDHFNEKGSGPSSVTSQL